MTTTGLDVFDKTLHSTHVWLDEIMADLGPDRRVAWKVLGSVLHAIRDGLQVDLAAHLGAQLPLLVRGLYYDQFHPARQPVDWHSPERLFEAVSDALSDIRPVDPQDAVASVFALLSRHLSAGQVGKVRQAMPHGIRAIWQAPREALAASKG